MVNGGIPGWLKPRSIVLLCCVAIFVLIVVGFLVFIAKVPRLVEAPSRVTDAIVVLTGGSERIVTGLDLLESGWARKMFVSGVSTTVDLDELLAVVDRTPSSVRGDLEVGHEARDTLGNAIETAKWLEQNQFNSIRLVTAGYHMPRSLKEFFRLMPDAEIVPHPVFPSHVHLDHWWMWSGSTILLLNEYAKFLVSYCRIFFDSVISIKK